MQTIVIALLLYLHLSKLEEINSIEISHLKKRNRFKIDHEIYCYLFYQE